MIFLLCSLSGTTCWADEIFYVPNICPDQEMHIAVSNHSDGDKELWFQYRLNEQFQESKTTIEANQTSNFYIPDSVKSFLKIKIRSSQKKALQFNLLCDNKPRTQITSFVASAGAIKNYKDNKVTLDIINLYFKEQFVQFYFLDKAKRVLQATTIDLEKYFETKNVQLNIPLETEEIYWQSTGRIHLNNQELSFVASTTRLKPTNDKTYFLVSNPDKTQGFVISLSDEKIISEAREIIRNKYRKIIIGKYTSGHNSENRNFYCENKLPWSWSVSEVLSFKDVSLIDDDGTPELIEERGPASEGKMSFWNYFLEKELSLEEIQTGSIR